MVKKKERSKPNNYVKAGLYGTGTALLGQQTIRSGIPRILGVRLESHSTSKKNAKSILNNGGYIDPNYGGSGASKAVNQKDFIDKSSNQVHITGFHPKGTKLDLGSKIVTAPDGSESIEKIYKNFKDIPPLNAAYRKVQRGMYRGIAGENLRNAKDMIRNTVLGLTGLKGRTLYLGGSDRYYSKNFTPDPDDIGLKSSKKVKVFGNRFAAVGDTLNRYGKGNYIKGAINLMGANKSRVAAGLGILGTGSLATAYLGKKTIESFGNVKSYNRKSKSGKIVKVKSYKRK